LTGIDGATAARPQGWSQPSDQPLFDLLGPFNAEFVVEWQVAEHGTRQLQGIPPEK
jgi:hypothetical protein